MKQKISKSIKLAVVVGLGYYVGALTAEYMLIRLDRYRNRKTV